MWGNFSKAMAVLFLSGAIWSFGTEVYLYLWAIEGLEHSWNLAKLSALSLLVAWFWYQEYRVTRYLNMVEFQRELIRTSLETRLELERLKTQSKP